MNPSERFRENIFAVRNKIRIKEITKNEELSEGALLFLLNHDWYHRIIHSFVWELELPFMCCFALEKLRDFPIKRVKGIKERIRKQQNIPSMTTEEMGKRDQILKMPRDTKDQKKKMSNDFDALKKQINRRISTEVDNAFKELDDVSAYALIENDKIQDIIDAVENSDGGFTAIHAREHIGEAMEEMLEKLPKRGDDSDSLNWGILDYKMAVFNNEVWDLLEPIKEPLQDLVRDSWETHALYLADAMTTFDFKKKCVRANDFLAFDNVSRGVVADYHRSFKKIGDEAISIVDELRSINKRISRIAVEDERLKLDTALRRERYLVLQENLEIFIARVNGKPESTLCICDCSPTGFLNYFMPPV